MPDSRMSLTFLTGGAEKQHSHPYPPQTQQTLPSRTSMRPSISQHRVYSSQNDPWTYPLTSRSNSTYSVYSNTSAQSISSLESVPQLTTMRNPGLERHDSSDSSQSGPISPVTPIEPLLLSAQPVTIASNHARLEELAAGAALTSMRTQLPCASRPAPPAFSGSPYMAAPPSPTHDIRRSQSPRPLRDINGNRLYPCPLAATYRCEQHFSTSGHARRHSRIHTGERGAECPECGQKFSRQDNMQQHRRTHRNGRDGRRTGPAISVAETVKVAGKIDRQRGPLSANQ